jgi:hypothetical protein
MGVIAWDEMAVQDLQVAATNSTVMWELLDLPETELRYPPEQGADEGFTIQYDQGFAYRRAVRRSAPSMAADLAASPATVPSGGFPYWDFFYLYRRLNEPEWRAMGGQRGSTARLMIVRLLKTAALERLLSRDLTGV